MNATNT